RIESGHVPGAVDVDIFWRRASAGPAAAPGRGRRPRAARPRAPPSTAAFAARCPSAAAPSRGLPGGVRLLGPGRGHVEVPGGAAAPRRERVRPRGRRGPAPGLRAGRAPGGRGPGPGVLAGPAHAAVPAGGPPRPGEGGARPGAVRRGSDADHLALLKKTRREVFRHFRLPGALAGPRGRQKTTQDEKPVPGSGGRRSEKS
ncbi:unnamed protein product, partial [Prorocentrum cordatum]